MDYYIDSSKANKESLQKKILLGLPFHGMMMDTNSEEPRGNFLDGKTFSNLVGKSQIKHFNWDANECEHMMKISSQDKDYIATYPTKKFFTERLDYTKKNNLAGVAIWDLAQGLDSFLDQF